MAARKTKAPPAGTDDEGTDGVPDVGAGDADASTDAGPPAVEGAVPPTSEEQIRQSAERKLEERTGDQSVKLSKALARANGLEGELKREKQARTQLEKQVVELSAALATATTAASQAGTAISGLPDNARQLNESVTIHVLGRGGTTPRRAQVKASDVLLVTKDDEEVDALQQTLGLQATVFKVSKATLDDLEQSGHLHS